MSFPKTEKGKVLEYYHHRTNTVVELRRCWSKRKISKTKIIIMEFWTLKLTIMVGGDDHNQAWSTTDRAGGGGGGDYQGLKDLSWACLYHSMTVCYYYNIIISSLLVLLLWLIQTLLLVSLNKVSLFGDSKRTLLIQTENVKNKVLHKSSPDFVSLQSCGQHWQLVCTCSHPLLSSFTPAGFQELANLHSGSWSSCALTCPTIELSVPVLMD